MVIMLVTYGGQVALNLMNFFVLFYLLMTVVISLQLVNSMVTLLIFKLMVYLCFCIIFFLFVAFGCNQSIREKKNALPLVTYTTLPTCQ